MLDRKFVRENLEKVRWAVAAKHDAADLERWSSLDAEILALKREGDALRAERNARSKEFGKVVKGLSPEERAARQKEMEEMKEGVSRLEAREKHAEEELLEIDLRLPNIPHETVPVGETAEQNAVVGGGGRARTFDFEPSDHHTLIERLGLVDFERGARIAGSGFPLFWGAGARLERGLVQFMLDLHTREHDYIEVRPPTLVNRQTIVGTGQVPKFEEDMYRTQDGLYLIPTAEVPVTNIHAGEVLEEERLPLAYCAYTPCFRREAGAHGKETRGLVRVHEFDKVELVRFTAADRSWQEHEKLLAQASLVLDRLGLHYRVVLLCTGDLGFAAAKCYDLEAWAPASRRWFEVSSCSNFLDFQARRAAIRYRDASGKVRHVHTLNASGLALPRIVICLLETYQEADGRVAIPDPLRPYMAGATHLGPLR